MSVISISTCSNAQAQGLYRVFTIFSQQTCSDSGKTEAVSAHHQWLAALLAAALLNTIRASTATPVLALIRNGLTSIEAMREPASAIRLDSPTSAFTAEASCSVGLPR